jgi:hypothetical protein
MKNKMLLASLVVSAGLAASTTTASACGLTTNYNFTGGVNPFENAQLILWSNGTAWACSTPTNGDQTKYFNRGTAIRHEINMSDVDNCKLYKTTNGGNSWTFWFSPSSQGISISNKSRIGNNTNGIRLGC